MRQDSHKIGAVVISSSYTALSVVRSLGRRGIPVWILDNDNSPTGLSRYVKKKIFATLDDKDAMLNLLTELPQKYDISGWVLFPDSDKGVAFIADHYEELSKYYRLTTPAWDTIKWTIDKKSTNQLLTELEVDFPRAFYPKDRSDVELIDGMFPMIVKPMHHQLSDRFSLGRAWRASTKAELLSLYDEFCEITDPSIILIQEMIVPRAKTQLSYGALCKEGKVVADTFAERVRLTPPDFGSSSYVESIYLPEIEIFSQRILEKMMYTGIVELEYMFDARDGCYKLIDINTRAWGWIAMCAYAGVDFPYLMWKLVIGEEVSSARTRPGIRWIRTLDDLVTSVKLIRRGDLTIGQYIKSLYGVKHQLYVLDDLRPAIIDIQQLKDWLFSQLRRVYLKK